MKPEIIIAYEEASAALSSAESTYHKAYTAWEKEYEDIHGDEEGARQALKNAHADYMDARSAHSIAEAAFDAAEAEE